MSLDFNEVYRSLVEAAVDPMFTSDASGRYLYVNPAAAAMLGRAQHDVIGHTVDELFPPAVAEAYRRGVRHVIETGETLISEDRSEIGGQTYWFSSVVQPLRDHSGRVVAAQAVVRDVTALKRTEQALRESDERLRQAVRVANIGIFEHDHASDRVYLSPELREIFGLGPAADFVVAGPGGPGRGSAAALMDSLHPDDRPRFRAALQRAHDPDGDGIYEVENRHVRPDGTIRWLTTRAQTFFEGEGAARRAVRTVGAVRDITDLKAADQEREALQAQLSQAQKMESVGRLAGGVAHDFNNMLNVILGWTGLALLDIGADHALHTPLREIQTAAGRSAALTRQLLAFARRQAIAPKVLDLNACVAESLSMLGRMIGEDVRVSWLPGRDLWLVRVDPGQVDQILANLAANARDAITGVGSVTITTENVVFDRAHCAAHPVATPGDFVRLRVADDGAGMTEETRAHIFEPFFTTKPVGQGTGLGLATVYGIVTQNHGTIEIESAAGAGTVVTICLPRFTGATAPAGPDSRADRPQTGRETILLVEDEPMMLDLSRSLLEKLGYRVLAAPTPVEALTLADLNAPEIQLLLTDVVMPGMSGPDLAARLVRKFPHFKCLYASGHFTDGQAPSGALGAGAEFLQKPFSLADLAAKVRKVLDTP